MKEKHHFSFIRPLSEPQSIYAQVKGSTTKCRRAERISQSYLREQLVHSFLYQWIEILHGVAGGTGEGVLAFGTLQIHNSVLDVSSANAQENAEGDGRHGAKRGEDVQRSRAAVVSLLPGRQFFLHFFHALRCSSRHCVLHLTNNSTRCWEQTASGAESPIYGTLLCVSEWASVRVCACNAAFTYGDFVVTATDGWVERRSSSSRVKSTCVTACRCCSCKLVARSFAKWSAEETALMHSTVERESVEAGGSAHAEDTALRLKPFRGAGMLPPSRRQQHASNVSHWLT